MTPLPVRRMRHSLRHSLRRSRTMRLLPLAVCYAIFLCISTAVVLGVSAGTNGHVRLHVQPSEAEDLLVAQDATSYETLSWWQHFKRFLGFESDDDDSDDEEDPLPEYDESTAVYLARVTSVAYCQAHHIRNWSCSPCALVKPLTEINVVGDTKDTFQGIVGYNKELNAVLVAFRGSMDIRNWLDNLTFVKKKAYTQYPDVRVHQGFYWVYQSVESQVVPAVRKLLKEHPKATVMVTGHSLGGAVAALCAFDLSLIQKLRVDALYSFGEPRVGNTNFSALLNTAVREVYRVTHFRDVVPHLPPSWIGFRHTSQEIYYDEFASSYRVCDPSDGEDPLCSDACSPFGCTSVVDHLTYVNVTMSHLIC